MLEVRDLTKRFRSATVVDRVSFTLRPGEITGYLGPNGSGKSTTVKMIVGLLHPSEGRVLFEGRDVREDPAAFKSRLGYVPEEPNLYSYLTGLEYLQLAGRLRGMEAAEVDRKANQLLESLALAEARWAPIASYSKGMRQRAKVAAALVHDPAVLVLDEPFNGMDPRQRLHMMALLRELAGRGRVILFSSHILEEVERVAERVLVVVAGRLAASGDFREIRRLMTDRPHSFTLRTSDDRALASRLAGRPTISGLAFDGGRLDVRTTDFAAFTRELPVLARDAGVSIFELAPADESLESVFDYLVRR